MSTLILNHRAFIYNRLNQEQTQLTCDCISCHKPQTFVVSSEGLFYYQCGEKMIQDCFPDIAPEIRELMISGMCNKCWKELFSSSEDE